MVRRGSGSKPPRNKPLIYRRAASRGIVSKTMEGSNFTAKTIQAVIKRTIVECNCSDDTNADDGDTKKRPRERRRVGEE
ncbi:hypothetical protein T03_12017 [Trichinella britovi]|uniref:Uncharacterized protein n=1 Tax=Trichinella britovi TaxID=45882 RepID=A0A0V0YYW0_TRIBR|nr:hypothetical protein T03_12017 [Trichinella britovi]